MKTNRKNTVIKILPILLVLFWVGCEDLDFSDPNNPTAEAADIQSLITGAESGLRIDLGVYLRDVNVVGREAYYFEPADPRYTGELSLLQIMLLIKVILAELSIYNPQRLSTSVTLLKAASL